MNITHGWIRKAVIIASVLNIAAIVLIVLSIVNFTPLTLLLSIALSGALMATAIILYVIVVLINLRQRGVL